MFCSGPQLCYKVPLLHTIMVSLDHFGMLQVLLSRFYSLRVLPSNSREEHRMRILSLKSSKPASEQPLICKSTFGSQSLTNLIFIRVFTVFGIMTNILVTAMLLTGGAAVISSLTGMVGFRMHFDHEMDTDNLA